MKNSIFMAGLMVAGAMAGGLFVPPAVAQVEATYVLCLSVAPVKTYSEVYAIRGEVTEEIGAEVEGAWHRALRNEGIPTTAAECRGLNRGQALSFYQRMKSGEGGYSGRLIAFSSIDLARLPLENVTEGNRTASGSSPSGSASNGVGVANTGSSTSSGSSSSRPVLVVTEIDQAAIEAEKRRLAELDAVAQRQRQAREQSEAAAREATARAAAEQAAIREAARAKCAADPNCRSRATPR